MGAARDRAVAAAVAVARVDATLVAGARAEVVPVRVAVAVIKVADVIDVMIGAIGVTVARDLPTERAWRSMPVVNCRAGFGKR